MWRSDDENPRAPRVRTVLALGKANRIAHYAASPERGVVAFTLASQPDQITVVRVSDGQIMKAVAISPATPLTDFSWVPLAQQIPEVRP